MDLVTLRCRDVVAGEEGEAEGFVNVSVSVIIRCAAIPEPDVCRVRYPPQTEERYVHTSAGTNGIGLGVTGARRSPSRSWLDK